MPNNRVKTTKALQSKKGKAVLSKLHPHSRRAKQINRIALREDKLIKNKKEKKKVGNQMTNRLMWFLEAFNQLQSSKTTTTTTIGMTIDSNHDQQQQQDSKKEEESNYYSCGCCSISELHSLVNKFIDRNYKQIQEEEIKRKSKNYLSSRPKSTLQEKLEINYLSELDQYSLHGFVVPDLTTKENVKLIQRWKDEHRCDDSFLKRIRLIRVFKNQKDKIIEEHRGALVIPNESPSDSDNGVDVDDEEDVQLIETDD